MLSFAPEQSMAVEALDQSPSFPPIRPALGEWALGHCRQQ